MNYGTIKVFKIFHYIRYHKESGLRGQMVICGLDESVDNGLIGYSDSKFEFYSPLNEENQQKVHDYIDRQGSNDVYYSSNEMG